MRSIYIYTSLFPYSMVAENFLELELQTAARMNMNVCVVPVSKDNEARQLPPDIRLDNGVCNASLLNRIKAALFAFRPKIIKQIVTNWERIRHPRNVIDFFKYLFAAGLVYNDVRRKADEQPNCLFYSYWLSYPPIAFALYKSQHPGNMHRFIARGHGSDVYSSTASGVFYPLRKFVFQNLDRIFIVSSYGAEFLKKKYPEAALKIEVSRLGVLDNGIAHEEHNAVNLISCARVCALKRINLMFRSIVAFARSHSKQSFTWTHVGGGEMFYALENEIKQTEVPSNLKVSLLGNRENKYILDLYGNNVFDCFLLTSTTEGIPVAIMEAISSGIPVLSTDVGGVKEIVTKGTGRTIPANFTQDEFDEALDYIIINKRNLSKSAHDFYLRYYNSDANYKEFYDKISK